MLFRGGCFIDGGGARLYSGNIKGRRVGVGRISG